MSSPKSTPSTGSGKYSMAPSPRSFTIRPPWARAPRWTREARDLASAATASSPRRWVSWVGEPAQVDEGDGLWMGRLEGDDSRLLHGALQSVDVGLHGDLSG